MIPNLIHPVTITIEQIDKSNTNYDPYFKESTGKTTRKKRIELQGQVKYQQAQNAVAGGGGLSQSHDGYILFRVDQLNELEVTLKHGDLVVSIGDAPFQRVANLYLHRFNDVGHYTDVGGSTLLKAFFMDRSQTDRKV